MKKKITLLLVAVLVILAFTGVGCFKKEVEKEIVEEEVEGEEVEKVEKTDEEQAIEAAKEIFVQKKKEGLNMSSGPCISEKLELDPPLSEWWVADVAHSPRIAEDNKPENQCQSWGEGKAKHFVELDLNGDLIKAY
jgi:uncharacterized iron-regulated membrane protein